MSDNDPLAGYWSLTEYAEAMREHTAEMDRKMDYHLQRRREQRAFRNLRPIKVVVIPDELREEQ